jgi:hypothetical protein
LIRASAAGFRDIKELGADRLVLPDLPLAGFDYFARRMRNSTFSTCSARPLTALLDGTAPSHSRRLTPPSSPRAKSDDLKVY